MPIGALGMVLWWLPKLPTDTFPNNEDSPKCVESSVPLRVPSLVPAAKSSVPKVGC